jgi:hypothetical protein
VRCLTGSLAWSYIIPVEALHRCAHSLTRKAEPNCQLLPAVALSVARSCTHLHRSLHLLLLSTVACISTLELKSESKSKSKGTQSRHSRRVVSTRATTLPVRISYVGNHTRRRYAACQTWRTDAHASEHECTS